VKGEVLLCQGHIVPGLQRGTSLVENAAQSLEMIARQQRRDDAHGERLDERADLISVTQGQGPVEGPTRRPVGAGVSAARAHENAAPMLHLHEAGSGQR
jgi:hypothetical protein